MTLSHKFRNYISSVPTVSFLIHLFVFPAVLRWKVKCISSWGFSEAWLSRALSRSQTLIWGQMTIAKQGGQLQYWPVGDSSWWLHCVRPQGNVRVLGCRIMSIFGHSARPLIIGMIEASVVAILIRLITRKFSYSASFTLSSQARTWWHAIAKTAQQVAVAALCAHTATPIWIQAHINTAISSRLSNQISGRASFPPIMVCVVCFNCIHLIKELVKQCRGSSAQSLHQGTMASPKLSYRAREITSGRRPPQQVLPMEWILIQGSFANLNPLTHTSWKNMCVLLDFLKWQGMY